MRIQQVDITEVFFQTKEYTQGMYDSIVRIGLSFPVKVSLEQGKFYCQDGHKRLSAIASMEKLEVYKKRRKINIIVINNVRDSFPILSELKKELNKNHA